jgi:hypothetical protein
MRPVQDSTMTRGPVRLPGGRLFGGSSVSACPEAAEDGVRLHEEVSWTPAHGPVVRWRRRSLLRREVEKQPLGGSLSRPSGASEGCRDLLPDPASPPRGGNARSRWDVPDAGDQDRRMRRRLAGRRLGHLGSSFLTRPAARLDGPDRRTRPCGRRCRGCPEPAVPHAVDEAPDLLPHCPGRRVSAVLSAVRPTSAAAGRQARAAPGAGRSEPLFPMEATERAPSCPPSPAGTARRTSSRPAPGRRRRLPGRTARLFRKTLESAGRSPNKRTSGPRSACRMRFCRPFLGRPRRPAHRPPSDSDG